MGVAAGVRDRLGIRIILALVLVSSLLLSLVPQLAVAQCPPGQESPDPCGANNFDLDPATDPAVDYVHQGQVAPFWVYAGNDRGTPPAALGCDAWIETIRFFQPGADGSPGSVSGVLDSSVMFPANSTNNHWYMPADYLILNYTVNVNTGVTTITGLATADGTLCDGKSTPTDIDIDKEVAYDVLWPAVEVTKVANCTSARPGQTVRYTITVTNRFQHNDPADQELTKISIIDSMFGNITGSFTHVSLPLTDNFETQYFDYTVQPGDPDPLVNTVTVEYHDKSGWPVYDSDDDEVDQPEPPPPPPPTGQAWMLKLLDMFEAYLDFFVQASVRFDKGAGGQWELAHLSSSPTEKGWAVLDSIVGIIHNGLDFGAQFSTLLPAESGANQTSMTPRSFLPGPLNVIFEP